MATIFVSYRREDAPGEAALVARLLAERFGQETVFLDVETIEPGADWRQRLAEGLGQCRVMFVVIGRDWLSAHDPQGRRRLNDPNDVVRQEILEGLAREPGLRLVPLLVRNATAPLESDLADELRPLGRREGEVLHHASFEADLEALITRLLPFLPPELVEARAKRIGSPRRLPQPLDFDLFLAEKRKDFTGREWFFERIEGWVRTGPRNALLVTGAPGIGKSAVVAELIRANHSQRVLAWHCCQWDVSETLDATRFVLSLAGTIAGRLPAYAERLMAEDLQAVLRDPETAKRPAILLESLVLAPLSRLDVPQDAPKTIVIDALDEGLTASPSIAEVLASRMDRFPAWLRVVATSRAHPETLQKLAGMRADEIGTHQPGNQDDLQQYVVGRLGRLHEAAEPIHEVSGAVLRASEGNFLVAKSMLDVLEAGDVKLSDLAAAGPDRASQGLPAGLLRWYGIAFDRLFTKNMDAYAPARLVLEVAVAAREPLTARQIGTATGLGQDTLPKTLRQLTPFLPPRGGRFGLFHKSLGDWLTGRDEVYGDSVAAPYEVEAADGHARLADMGWAEYQQSVASLSVYSLDHLGQHLAGTGRFDQLRTLLLDFEWIQTKLDRAEIGPLLSDYELLPPDADGTDDLPAHQAAKQLQRALAKASYILARDPKLLAPQLLARLTAEGSAAAALLEKARRHAPPDTLLPRTPSLTSIGAVLRRLHRHSSYVSSLLLIGGGRVVSAGEDGVVQLLALDGSAEPRQLAQHAGGVTQLALTGDGRVVSAGWDGVVQVLALDGSAEPRRLAQHLGGVVQLAVTGDDRVVSAGADGVVQVLTLDGSAEPRQLAQHAWLVAQLALTGDGRVVSAGWDGVVLVLALDGSAEPRRLGQHAGIVRQLVLTGDGRVVSAGDDGVVQVLAFDGSAESRRLGQHAGGVAQLALTSDGRVVSADADGVVQVLALDGSAEPRRLGQHAGGVAQLARTGTGWVVSAGADGVVQLLALDGSAEPRRLGQHAGGVAQLALTGDDRVISAGADGVVQVLALDDSTEPRRLGQHADGVTQLALTSDGRVVSAGWDGVVQVLALDGGVEPRRLGQHLRRVTQLALTGTGRVVSAGADGVVQVLTLDGSTEPRRLGQHEGNVTQLALTGTGRVVSAGADGVVQVLTLDGSAEPGWLGEHAGIVRQLVLTGDGRVVSAGDDGVVQVLAFDGSAESRRLGQHAGGVAQLALTSDGRVVSAGDDGIVQVLALDGSADPRRLGQHFRRVTQLALTSDGRVVSAGDDGIVQVLALDGSADPRRLGQHFRRVTQLALTSDGRVVSVHDDGVVQVLTLDGSAAPRPLGHHASHVGLLALTGDGHVVSAGWDGVVQVLALDGTAEPHRLGQHAAGVTHLALTGDGRVVSAGKDARIHVWNTSNRQRVARWEGDYGITRLVFALAENLIVAGDGGGNVHLLELRS